MSGHWFRQKSKNPHGLHGTEASLCSQRTMVRANDSTHRRPPAITQPRASLPSRRGLGDDDRAAGRRHADYEYGLHLNQLDLVTAFAGDRPDERLATVPSPGATRLSILTSSKRSPLPCRSRRGATVASARSASAAQAGCVDFGQRLAGGDDKHSQPNAKLANGQQICMRCARPSTRRRAGPWAPIGHQRQALLSKSSHHGTAPATVGGATSRG